MLLPALCVPPGRGTKAGISQEMDSDPSKWGLEAPSTTHSGTGSREGTALAPKWEAACVQGPVGLFLP